jgi:hypothetical protein
VIAGVAAEIQQRLLKENFYKKCADNEGVDI